MEPAKNKNIAAGMKAFYYARKEHPQVKAAVCDVA